MTSDSSLPEHALRSLGDNLPDSYVYQATRDAGGKLHFLYLSGGVERIHGIAAAAARENAGLIEAQTVPADLPGLLAREADCLERMRNFAHEFRIRRADGGLRWLSARSHPSRQADGRVVWDGVVSDVTAQKDNEETLSLLTRRALCLLSLPELADSLDEAGFIRRGLEMAEELTGSTLSFLHLVHEDAEAIELAAWSDDTPRASRRSAAARRHPIGQAGIWAEAFRRRAAVTDDAPANAPAWPGLPPDHAPITRMVALPVIDAGKVVALASIGNKPAPYTDRDAETLQLLANDIWRIARKKRAEQELRDALRALEASPVVSFRWRARADWPIEYVSRNVARWGYRAEDLMAGRPGYPQLIHPDDLPRIADEVARHTAAGASEYVQHYRVRAADGRCFWVEDSTHVLRDADGAAIAYEGVVTDIDARKRYELELAENLARQKELNSQLEKAHSQLLQSEKMASIGQLAAGVAHELNNPIGFVSSNLGSLENYLRDLFAIVAACDAAAAAAPPDCAELRHAQALKQDRDYDFLREDIFQLLAESKDGLARVAKIVRDLKDFSHAGEARMQWADLHQGLDSTLNVVWNELKYKCVVTKEYGDLPRVWCEPSQLNQVFMNLLVNAGQAIAEKGEIAIRTGRRGDAVFVAIADNGTGIPPENIQRIFDPFFTTKPVGKGTGLGLSLSYGIVRKHGGRIEVDSAIGRGTTFTVWLPIEAAADTVPPAPSLS